MFELVEEIKFEKTMFLSTKTFNTNSIQTLFSSIKENNSNIIIDKIYIKYKRKQNSVVEWREETFCTEKELYKRLDNINSIIQMRIELSINKKIVCINFRDKFFLSGWYLEYNEDDELIDGLKYRLKRIFRKSVLSLYRANWWPLFTSTFLVGFLLLTTVTVKEKLVKYNIHFIFAITLTVIVVEMFIFKNIPYKNRKIWQKYKRDIIFCAIGVMIPIIIDLLVKLINL